MDTVVFKGFGPHVRIRTTGENTGTVRVLTNDSVKSVTLNRETNLTFNRVA